MVMWRHLVMLLAITFTFAGCLGLPFFQGTSGTGVQDGLPIDKELIIPKTDAELSSHVPGELLVRLNKGVSEASVLEAVDGTITGRLDSINMVRISLAGEERSVTDALRTLQRVAGARWAHANQTGYALFEENVTDEAYVNGQQYGPQKIGAEVAWDEGITGEGVVIAIVDSGVDVDHPDLVERMLVGYNVVDDSTDVTDFQGHGTHVAGIAAASRDGEGMVGVAPEASILPINIIGPYTGISDFAIAYGILVAVYPEFVGLPESSKADVINLSLGGPFYSQAVQDAVNEAIQQNVVVVAAMGNDSKQVIQFPAAFEGVIAVGATDPNDARASFSTTGPHISVSAPGERIFSTRPFNEYARLDGTSMATPHVAGAVALIRDKYEGMSPSEVKYLLEQTASHKGAFDKELGYGRIDVAAALGITIGEDYWNTGSIKVTVTAADGEGGVPVPMADVILLHDDHPPQSVRTGTLEGVEGVAWFYDVPEGTGYTVRVTDLDGAVQSEEEIVVVANQSTEVEIAFGSSDE